MHQPRPIPTERLRTIRGQMVERFSLDELRDLTFDLGINWDQLLGSNNLSAKTTELLELLNHRTQLPALLVLLEALRPNEAWALDDLDESAMSPYKGLESYDEADAELFFGRESLTATLLNALRGQSFLAVVGASGSGKSSVVRAGVMPALRGDRPPPEGVALPPDCRRWAYLEMTPTGKPAEQLAITLTRDLTTAAATQTAIDDLGRDPATAALYLRKYLDRHAAPRAFLLVDQFEELFTVGKDEAARAAFNAGLLAVAESGQATVFITLRTDFLHRFIDYPQLWETLDQNKFVIRAMNEDELREAVEQPALTTGYELEPGLSDVIVRDVGQDAATLPLLSHALLETWRRREGWLLTHAGYNAAGGVGGAIAKTAERAYAGFDPAQQQIARRIFLELTELGEGAEDTRRSVPLADLLPDDPAKRAAAEVVLDTLYRARLVTADAETAQVTHEAIIREWPALREWLDNNREALRLERRLEGAATEWQKRQRDPSYLYVGAQLAAACEWAAGHPDNAAGNVRAFLDAATAEEEREAAARETARRQRERLERRALVGISVFAALATLAAVFAFLQRNAAVVALNDSRARLLLNQSESVFERDPLLADRLLLEAMAVAGSENAINEATVALSANLLSGLTTVPITATTVLDFTGVHTGTVYLADYQFGNDGLISGATGELIASLSGNLGISTGFNSIESPFFVVSYTDASGELRRTDDDRHIVPLNGNVDSADSILKTPFFVVDYSNAPGELRRTDDDGLVVPLSGNVLTITPIPDSPIFAITYSDARDELRRTDDAAWVVPLNFIDFIIPIPDSPFFVVNYSNAPGELRRTDDAEQGVLLNGDVTTVIPIPNGPFFVNYSNAPGELRRADDGDEINPLIGDVLEIISLPDSPFFFVDYFNAPGELRRINDGDVVPLNSDIATIIPIPDSPFFVVDYSAAPGELRRTDDSSQVVPLSGDISFVTIVPASPYFVVSYTDAPGELRRTDAHEQIILLGSSVVSADPIADSPFFVVDYPNAPGELRRIDDENVVLLNGNVVSADSILDSLFFVVKYTDAPNELRRTDSGEVFMDAEGLRMASDADVLGTKDNGRYVIYYQDGTAEIVRNNRALVDLGAGVVQSLYFPETNRVAIRYGDGRVHYIDLNLIEALGGANAVETLAAMSPEELVAFTCATLFSGNPDWDEARLGEYLALLPDGTPQACQP